MGEGSGSGSGNLCPGLIWAVLWFFALIIVGWPVGFLLGYIYIFLLPFSVCIDPIKSLCEALFKLVKLPLLFAQNMLKMKPCCS